MMKAITVWQPWAQLIAIGAKPYEFRKWCPPRWMWGKHLAIHAGKRAIDEDELRDLYFRVRSGDASTCLELEPALALLDRVMAKHIELPKSCIVATCILTKCIRADEIVGEFGIATNDSDRAEHFNWAWKLDEVQPRLTENVRGAQGLWEWRP
jgi:hypothetical protein